MAPPGRELLSKNRKIPPQRRSLRLPEGTLCVKTDTSFSATIHLAAAFLALK